jgi:UDP-GlcNAc:undecaprenyl-phosphate GlcNAc-1-phosphate transferase
MDLLLAFVLAMGVTMLLVPALMRIADRWHVLDLPGPRKVHARPMPRVGGIAMVAGAIVPLLLWLNGNPTLTAYLAAALLLLAFGVWDDRTELGYAPKLLGQLLAALIVVLWGGVLIHSVTLTERVEMPDPVAYPLTILFLVGITNAINLADGLDGLAGGTTLLSCCAMALLALTMGDHFVATVAIVLAGSILGFLRYNTYPARIFMGDGGSQFLGFSVAVVAVRLTQDAAAPVSTALPLLLLGLPIIDTLLVMAQRIASGRSPFAADRNHIHHRLLALGFHHHEAVVVIYLLQGILFLVAWFTRYESDLLILLLFGVFAIVVVGTLTGASRIGWRWQGLTLPGDGARHPQSRGLQYIRERLPDWALLAVAAGSASYAALVVAVAVPASADVGWLALMLALLLLALLLYARGHAGATRSTPDWPLHGALYVGAVLLVYLDVSSPVERLPAKLELLGTSALAASAMIYFRMTTVRRFALTSLDFLLIFVVLVVPNLPGSIATPRALGLGAVRLLVLFYSIEMLLGHSTRSRDGLHLAAVVTLGCIACRWLA